MLSWKNANRTLINFLNSLKIFTMYDLGFTIIEGEKSGERKISSLKQIDYIYDLQNKSGVSYIINIFASATSYIVHRIS